MEKRIRYAVQAEDLPCTVEALLKKRLGLTAHQIRSAKFRQEGITLNGVRTRITGCPKPGDLLEVLLEQEEDCRSCMEAAGEPPEILYEDEDLIVVNKQPGIPVHPGHGHYQDTLANRLLSYFQQKGERVTIRAVGRLDKDTSGIVVFAKNRVAATRLAGNGIQKEYLALVRGHLPEQEGCVELPIAKKAGALNQMEISGNGSFARTHYRVLEEYEKESLVRLWLDTGRTHQIRVHMAALGCPLLGDPIYGGTGKQKKSESETGEETESGCREKGKFRRTALHCVQAEILQPFSGKKIWCRAALPEDFLVIVQVPLSRKALSRRIRR